MLTDTGKENTIFAQLCTFISVLWVSRVVGHAGRDAKLSIPHFKPLASAAGLCVTPAGSQRPRRVRMRMRMEGARGGEPACLPGSCCGRIPPFPRSEKQRCSFCSLNRKSSRKENQGLGFFFFCCCWLFLSFFPHLTKGCSTQ